MDLSYRLINVFAESHDPFSGNAITIFDDGSGLSEGTMQAIARQMNVETVFILSRSGDSAEIRFFSPEGPGRFAGSASLATAQVLDDLNGNPRREMRLEAGDGVAPVTVSPYGKDNWEVSAREAHVRHLKSSPQILASLVGLPVSAIESDVMVIDSGRSGVVLPVKTEEHVRTTNLDARMLHSYAMLLNTEPQVYVWARRDDGNIVSRMFYGPRGGVLEVSATGSGAANLGHWLAAHGEHGTWRVRQGAAVGRPSILDLKVEEGGNVFVGGHVNAVARGTLTLPEDLPERS